MLSTSLLAGCGSKSSTSSTDTTTKLKPVTLQFYMVGDAPKDLQMVEDKVNALSTKDINATVKFNYTTWTDFGTKYNLLLSAGQPIDLIYTAAWLDYAKLARKGAFKPLEDLLSTTGADIKKFIPQTTWDQVKVDGKIYTMPSTYREYVSDGFQYRKDLQEKYSLPVPNTLENVEAYLEGVKKNVPGQILTNEFVNAGPQSYSFSAFEILSMKYKWVNFGTPYGLVADLASPADIKPYWGSADFTTDMKMFKTWADKGFWSRSALSNKTDQTAFDNGKVVAVIQGQNASKFGGSLNKAGVTHPDWKVGYAAYPDANGIATLAHATQNGYAIPNSSQNPERAMMFYQKLLLDKTYNQLTEYGIEGTHYTVKDGYYEGVGDPTKSGFAAEAMNGWGWRNPQFQLFPKSYDAVKTLFSNFDAIAAKQPKYKGINIYDGFSEDYTSYQSERAALGTVLTQYLAPIEAGLVPDVDAAIKTFMEKAKAAGLDKIQAEYTKQWKAYCTQYNYN
jgi:putative aldouronate transport system substrate-binding protein